MAVVNCIREIGGQVVLGEHSGSELGIQPVSASIQTILPQDRKRVKPLLVSLTMLAGVISLTYTFTESGGLELSAQIRKL